VDPTQVSIDGLDAEEHGERDLAVRPALVDQADHLHLGSVSS
jgi:hypothetical protein